MAKQEDITEKLPAVVAEYIEGVVRKVRYRRKIRTEVRQELAGHFADALQNCKSEDERQNLAKELITEFGDAKLLARLIRRGKKRCRPMWRTAVVRAFQTVGVCFLLLIIHCVYLSFAKPNIRVNYVERINELARQSTDESTNAAVLYDRAIELYKEEPTIEQREQNPPGMTPGMMPDTTGRDTIPVSLLRVIGDRERTEELKEDELVLLKKWISDNEPAIEIFRQAGMKPNCWWDRQAKDNSAVAISFPELTSIGNLGRVICWRAKLRASEGDFKGAIDELLACYRTGKHLKKGPKILIEQLVGIGMKMRAVRNVILILDNYQVDNNLLADFQEQLEKLKAGDVFVIDFNAERFCEMDLVQRCFTDNGRGGGRLIPAGMWPFIGMMDPDLGYLNHSYPNNKILNYGLSLGISLGTAGRKEITAEFDRLYQQAQSRAVKTPWQLREEKVVDFTMEQEKWSKVKQLRYWPVGFFMPALSRIGEISHSNRAEVEALITIVAVVRYGREKGGYPETLEELKRAGYLKETPSDPYSNKPLVYKRTDEGFILYSVGGDFIDDGGVRKGQAQWKGSQGGDWIFWPVETNQQRNERIKAEKIQKEQAVPAGVISDTAQGQGT